MLDKKLIDNMRGALGMLVKHADYLVKHSNKKLNPKGQDLELDNPGMQGSSDHEQMMMDDQIDDAAHNIDDMDDDPMLPKGQGEIMDVDMEKTGRNPVHAHMTSKNILASEDPEEEEDKIGPRKGMTRLHHMGVPISSHRRGKFERVI